MTANRPSSKTDFLALLDSPSATPDRRQMIEQLWEMYDLLAKTEGMDDVQLCYIDFAIKIKEYWNNAGFLNIGRSGYRESKEILQATNKAIEELIPLIKNANALKALKNNQHEESKEEVDVKKGNITVLEAGLTKIIGGYQVEMDKLAPKESNPVVLGLKLAANAVIGGIVGALIGFPHYAIEAFSRHGCIVGLISAPVILLVGPFIGAFKCIYMNIKETLDQENAAKSVATMGNALTNVGTLFKNQLKEISSVSKSDDNVKSPGKKSRN